jgi:acetyl-CoA C-acetyltransferase
VTFPGLYAMMARVHMQRYGTTRKQLAAVAVKNHRRLNPLAQFQSEITEEQVIGSTASAHDGWTLALGAGGALLGLALHLMAQYVWIV